MYLGLRSVTTTTVTTHIVLTTNLLTLTNMELEEKIEAELAENPALERVDSQVCPRCGATIEKPPCPTCLSELLAESQVQVDTIERPTSVRQYDDGDYDPMRTVAQPVRLADHIINQIRIQLNDMELVVARYLAELIDDRGFLTVNLSDVAQEFRVGKGLAEKVLHLIQLSDPVGVGSRSPQECLLRQLEAIVRDESSAKPDEDVLNNSRYILEECWDSFLHARWNEIPLSAHQVTEATNYIRANLTPFPAMEGWDRTGAGDTPTSPTNFTRPDMAIYIDQAGELGVEIFSIKSSWFRVSPSFRASIKANNGDQKNEWVDMAERARLFIKCLGQRQHTLSRAVEAVLAYQEQAIRDGDEFMRPLTRTKLAQALGVHEATVSRAILGKTASLPDGRIVQLSHFFESGKSTKEIIRRMIADEHKPLSDSVIARKLETLGHPVARRTVAKYRNMLGILPVHLRARQQDAVAV